MEAKKLLNANSDLLHRAKLEEHWLAENKEAIASYNEHLEKDGIFGSRTRSF